MYACLWPEKICFANSMRCVTCIGGECVVCMGDNNTSTVERWFIVCDLRLFELGNDVWIVFESVQMCSKQNGDGVWCCVGCRLSLSRMVICDWFAKWIRLV